MSENYCCNKRRVVEIRRRLCCTMYANYDFLWIFCSCRDFNIPFAKNRSVGHANCIVRARQRFYISLGCYHKRFGDRIGCRGSSCEDHHLRVTLMSGKNETSMEFMISFMKDLKHA